MIFKKIKTCKNKCIFCFINQLPPGLRPSLYIRDDDYLLSYMYGNFITLTNLADSDLKKIIKTGLSPLYVSVHSMDREIRKKIFGLKKEDRGPEYLGVLDDAGINTHIQIVLIPGLNDGVSLLGTLSGMVARYKNILSIGIVPAGITKFNKCDELKPLNRIKAGQTIDIVEEFKSGMKDVDLAGNICLSDEFFLVAGRRFPLKEYYGCFYQIENGIGKSRDFLDGIENYMASGRIHGRGIMVSSQGYLPGEHFRGIKENGNMKKMLIVTSEYGLSVIQPAIDIIYKNAVRGTGGTGKSGLHAEILAVKNRFLGENIRVTGLLSGKDVIDGILSITKNENSQKFKNILVPGCIFNRDGLTIDGYTASDIKKAVPGIRFIPESAEDMAGAVFDLQ